MTVMQKTLIVLGLAILLAGLAWPWLRHLPIGRLPGDITIELGGARLYLPIATSILISIVLTILLRLFR
ncbi:DUF2905 domain-containing protein [Rhodobacteraceae bacterium WD3A24]|nr:DUF2905 domain-containing protein [Rhodobacteraceae bacterium WD3A24]